MTGMELVAKLERISNIQIEHGVLLKYMKDEMDRHRMEHFRLRLATYSVLFTALVGMIISMSM